jgi:hypothetical protein
MTPPVPGGEAVAGVREHLVAAAIQLPDGTVESRGFKEHWRIRAILNYEDPYKEGFDNEEGFLTNTGRFVDRHEAREIGARAGQCMRTARKLISSDVDRWGPKP